MLSRRVALSIDAQGRTTSCYSNEHLEEKCGDI